MQRGCTAEKQHDSNFTTNGPLLSVVVPVYNMEKYLDRCVESMVTQTYRNLEIILVNDGSKDSSAQLMEKWQQADSRIRLVHHEQNRGLFQARLTGAALAAGKYIAFADSDDYVSVDYYRSLLECAENGGFEIVSGNTVREDGAGTPYTFTFHTRSLESKPVLYGNEVRNTFYAQEGNCYAWHTIWNKIYHKSLWDQCVKEYQMIQDHLIMTEDIAYSSVLFYFAQSYAHTNGGFYFYCENEEASTNATNISLKKFIKNMTDILMVFGFVRDFLERQQADPEIIAHFRGFQQHYYRIWKHTQEVHFPAVVGENQALQLVEQLNPHLEGSSFPLGYFESQRSKWYFGLENIKKQIADAATEVVSFDIFDTLLLRPLWNPADLFQLIQQSLPQVCPELAGMDYQKIRQLAENNARKDYCMNHPGAEDVTLEEIYQEFARLSNLKYEQVKPLELRERALELEISMERKAGKELFRFAKACAKRVVLISDMYLERFQIEAMLARHGYTGYEALFLSSDLRLTKFSGHLFDHALKTLQVPAETVMHIGDNWEHDICMARKKGMKTAFLPKTQDRFCDRLQEYPVHGLSGIGWAVGGALTTCTKQMDALGYRTMMALAAHRLFDDPFAPWNENSIFGGDPYNMGYYAVGMHLAGISKWLADLVKARNAENIVFLARDGYLPQKAFEQLQESLGVSHVKLHYVPCSRKSVLPWMVENEMGLLDLPVEHSCHTPMSLIELLSFCMESLNQEEMQERVTKAGFEPHRPFDTEQAYYAFLSWFRSNLFSQEALEHSKALTAVFYNQHIPEDSIVFDMGYSGKIPAALDKCLKHKAVYAYVHHNNKTYFDTLKQLDIVSMYHFVPAYSGWIREILLSERGNACVGLEESGAAVQAVLRDTPFGYTDNFAVEEVFRGALDFVREIANPFSSMGLWPYLEPESVSMPFEGLVQLCSWEDRMVFSAVYSDDEVYGNQEKVNMADFWNGLSGSVPLASVSVGMDRQSMISNLTFGKRKIVKLLVYALCDRKTMKDKIKKNLAGHPTLLAISQTGYALARKIWHMLKKHR